MDNVLIPQFDPEFRKQLKQLVVDSVTALESKRSYARSVDKFLDWFDKERPSTGLSKATVQRYRTVLVESGLSPSTISLNLTAIRCLAAEAADNGLLSSELAAAIRRVKSPKRHGLRIGTWLTASESEKLIEAPNLSTLKGKRDRAMLAVLIGGGLRREEAARLSLHHIQEREGRTVIVDLIGKGQRVRSIPMPLFAKEAIDSWVRAADLESGCVFRAVNRAGKVSGGGVTGQAILQIVTHYTDSIGLKNIGPHNLRRTYARLAHRGKATIEQIQLSMGHMSVKTCERYLGIQQDLTDGPCDHLNLNISSST